MQKACVGLSLIVLGSAAPVMAQAVNGYIDVSTTEIKGRLLVPNNYDPSKSYPMVVFLAGSGEIGGTNDNTRQISTHMSNLTAAALANNFFVYAPQTWRGTWTEDAQVEFVHALGTVTDNYNIDRSRMSLTGLSVGGQGTFETFSTVDLRGIFSDYVPLSKSGYSFSAAGAGEAARAVNTPFWFFHGAADANGPTNVAQSRGATNDILTAQGQAALTSWSTSANPTFNFSYNKVNYTEYLNGTHSDNVWNNGAYSTPGLYTWMLAQKSMVAAPVAGRPVLINLENNVNDKLNAADSLSRTWNNAGARYDGYTERYTLNTGATVPFAVDSTGARTTVNVTVTQKFINDNSDTKYPVANPNYDSFVAGSYWKTQFKTAGQLSITGLTPNAPYRLDILASIGDTDTTYGYAAKYDANGVNATLDAANNTSLLSLNSVIADSNGVVLLTVTPTGTSRYGIINSFSINAVPEPVALGMLVIPALLLMKRRERK